MSSGLDRIYAAEQIEVPPLLPEILKAYTKEVIRFNPENIVEFSKDYFTSLSDGSLDSFLDKQQKVLDARKKQENKSTQ